MVLQANYTSISIQDSISLVSELVNSNFPFFSQAFKHATGSKSFEIQRDVNVPDLLEPRNDLVHYFRIHQFGKIILGNLDPREITMIPHAQLLDAGLGLEKLFRGIDSLQTLARNPFPERNSRSKAWRCRLVIKFKT